MLISKLVRICLCVCLVAVTSPVRGQESATAARAPSKTQLGIPGYLDPKTGTFTIRAASQVPAVATTTVLARLIFNFNIQTDLPGTNTTCDVSISPNDSVGFYEESASATASSGGTACSVTILFSWDLSTPNSDTIEINYDVNASSTSLSRSTNHSLVSIPVPANFQTITEPTINVTI